MRDWRKRPKSILGPVMGSLRGCRGPRVRPTTANLKTSLPDSRLSPLVPGDRNSSEICHELHRYYVWLSAIPDLIGDFHQLIAVGPVACAYLPRFIARECAGADVTGAGGR